jgi:hypothetical protein
MQNNAIELFESLFFELAEACPETATRIAVALYAKARTTEQVEAMYAVCDPFDNASCSGPACPVCCPACIEDLP